MEKKKKKHVRSHFYFIACSCLLNLCMALFYKRERGDSYPPQDQPIPRTGNGEGAEIGREKNSKAVQEQMRIEMHLRRNRREGEEE